MEVVNILNPKEINFRKKICLFIILGILSAVVIFFVPFWGKAASEPRDFDANAVVRGGAYSKEELLRKINGGDGVHNDLRQIFYNENREITEQGIKNSVDGIVRKDGTVWVGNRQVASGVFSSGRSYIPGSTRDGSLWMRPPSVSFIPSQLEAFVIMEGNTFRAAIVKSCGNPVKVLAAPFPNVYKRVRNERIGGDFVAADTKETALKVKEGDSLKFSVIVTNQGTAAINNAVVTDPIPQGLNLKNPALNRTIVAPLRSIPSKDRKYFLINVTVAQGTAGKCIENIAFMTAEGGFRDRDSAWVCVEKEVAKEQSIKIIKFEDKDHDGRKDLDENVISGFKFRLDGKITKVTDSKGEVIFANVSVGEHKIEEIDIPTGYRPTNQNPFTVNIRSRENITRYFGNQKIVTPITEQNIKIIKFEDKDHDGVKDEGEDVLPGFTFKLDDKETKVTDKNGVVVFNNVSVGKHTITEINIPKGFIAVTQNPLTVDIPKGKTIEIFFGNQRLPAPPLPPVPPKIVPTVLVAPTAEAGITKGELPAAGSKEVIVSVLGIGVLVYAGYIYIIAKKRFIGALKNI